MTVTMSIPMFIMLCFHIVLFSVAFTLQIKNVISDIKKEEEWKEKIFSRKGKTNE